MRKLKISVLAASVLLWGMGCSSTETATTENNTTTEGVVATDSPAATGTAADATTDATATASIDSTSFAMVAASSDMFEVLSSTEAQSRAVNPEVKKFAHHMLTDHTKTTSELKTIAASKNITLPTSPLPMHQRMIQKVHNADAKEFDESYMEAQVMAHKQAVALYETASNNVTDPELKAFAAKTLPALRMHLEMAQKTKDLVD